MKSTEKLSEHSDSSQQFSKVPVYSASVVGGGYGGSLSLNALRDSPRYGLVGVADLRSEVREELKKAYPGILSFSSHEEMFAEYPTDIVCVSTYAPSHEEVTMSALRQPSLKGILVEKPLGPSTQAGRRILDAIKERNLPMVVPHGMRARATTLEIINRVKQGEIGQLKLIEVQCDKWDLLNAGIHWIDFCLAATSEEPVVSVLAAYDTSSHTYRDGIQVETEGVTYLENKTGVRMVLQTGDFIKVNAPGHDIVFRLVGTRGLIEFWGWEIPYFILGPNYPGGAQLEPVEFPVTGHRRHLETLAAQIDRGIPDYGQPASSLAALEICEASFLSHENRCRVILPLSTFIPPGNPIWELGKPYRGNGGRDGRKLVSI